MSKPRKDKKHTRKTFGRRWQMIREVRLPDGYTTPGKPYWRGGQKQDSSPKRVNQRRAVQHWPVPGHVITAVIPLSNQSDSKKPDCRPL